MRAVSNLRAEHGQLQLQSAVAEGEGRASPPVIVAAVCATTPSHPKCAQGVTPSKAVQLATVVLRLTMIPSARGRWLVTTKVTNLQTLDCAHLAPKQHSTVIRHIHTSHPRGAWLLETNPTDYKTLACARSPCPQAATHGRPSRPSLPSQTWWGRCRCAATWPLPWPLPSQLVC